MKKDEIKQWINDVYTKLWTLLSLYEETAGFNTVPEGEAEEDPKEFTSRKIGEIRSCVQNFSLYMNEQELAGIKEIAPGVVVADPEVDEIIYKLNQIVKETEYFVRQYEVPGVVMRWEMINSQLTYFDCVFDLMEKYPETYMEMKFERRLRVHHANNEAMLNALNNRHCSNYPDAELVARRNAYFEKIKERNERENMNWSEERIFQEELLNTLKLLFEDSFKEYL